VNAASAELVTYDGLPVASGGAHGLRARHPRAAWTAVQSFIDACLLPVATPTMSLRVWRSGPEPAREELIAFATRALGGPRSQDRTSMEWRLRPQAVDDVLVAIDAAGTGAVTPHGQPMASLTWDAEVRLIDPDTGEPWEGVSPEAFDRHPVDGYGRVLGASGVRTAIGTSASSLSLWLSLPGDERLPRAARHVQEHAPVRLSRLHWRRWRPTRDGSSYRSAKIPSPLTG
jgi:hypothetical protein